MTRRLLVLLFTSLLLALASIGLGAQAKPASGKPPAHPAPAMTVWTSDQGEWIPIPGTNAKMKVVKADAGKPPTDLYIWQPAGKIGRASCRERV